MSTPGDKVIVMVPMQLVEAQVLLHKLVNDLPQPLPYNFAHFQWDLMDENLDKLTEQIQKAKLVLSAVRKASQS